MANYRFTYQTAGALRAGEFYLHNAKGPEDAVRQFVKSCKRYGRNPHPDLKVHMHGNVWECQTKWHLNIGTMKYVRENIEDVIQTAKKAENDALNRPPLQTTNEENEK